MERFQNIKTSITNAKNIKIIFPENPSNDVLGSVLALSSALVRMKKNVFLLDERLPEKFKRYATNNGKKKISIALNEEIAEIYYEKKDNHVDLNIIPKNNNFDPKNFSWKIVSEKKSSEIKDQSNLDLIIIIGVLRFADIEKFLPTNEEDLFACTIVNIDNDPLNENYGDINIVENSLTAKIVSMVIKELNEFSFSKVIFDFLLFGFFSQEKISLDNVPTIKWIANSGGTLDIYFKHIEKERPLWVKYFENVLKNISLEESEEIIFSYLPRNENEINDEQAESTLQISKILKEWLNPKAFFLSFIENNTTKTIFYSSSSLIVRQISLQCKGSFKETGGIVLNDQDDPREAMESFMEKNFRYN